MEEKLFTLSSVDLKAQRTWCGPTVLRLLTGKTKDQIHRDVNKLIRAAGKKSYVTYKRCPYGTCKAIPWKLTNPVKGMSSRNMDKLLTKYKLKPKWVRVLGSHQKQTMASFAYDYATVRKPIVIVAGRHFMLLFEGKIYDTMRIEGEHPKEHPKAKARVVEYWVLNVQRKVS